MGKKEEEFRQKMRQENTTAFSGLLGRFTEEEQKFIAEIKGKRNKKERKSKYDFLPTEEQIDNYINTSLELLSKEEETR